jgi:hypothetical protein
MGRILAAIFSAGAAGLPPAFAFAIYTSVTNSFDYFPSSFLLAGIFASAHALILGLPAALVLTRMRLFRPIPMSVAGAVVGGLPLAAFTFFSPPHYWQSPSLMFASFSLLGVAGGLAFYFTYQALSPNNSFKPKPLRGSA